MDVKSLYLQYLQEGKTPKDAAKEAQARTGYSVVTGRPIRRQLDEKRFSKKTEYEGQYPAG